VKGPVGIRFVQRNVDRRDIYAVMASGALEPLRPDQIWPWLRPPHVVGHTPEGDLALARDLAARADEFHDLDDFYVHYGYPQEVLDWVVRTPLGDSQPWRDGYDASEVVDVLGIDLTALRDAGGEDGIDHSRLDPAGDILYYRHLGERENWAISDPSGRVRVDPSSYRFKAWLSYLPGPADCRP
jgi:hypothetical protein